VKYFDKSTGNAVELAESTSDFLMIGGGDGEAFAATTISKLFSIRFSTNRDHVSLLRLRSDAESLQSVQSEITRLRGQEGVRAVVPALIDAAGETRFVLPDRVNVQTRPDGMGATKLKLQQLGSEVTQEFRHAGLVEVSVPPGMALDQFIAALNDEPSILLAEPAFYGVDDQDVRVSISVAANRLSEAESLAAGADAGIAWNLASVRVPESSAISTGNSAVVVAVVDGMPQMDHSSLADKFVREDNDGNIFSSDVDLSSHATNIASIVAASGQVNGVAPGVRILPVIVNLNAQRYADRADAIRYVAQVARARRVGGTDISRVVMCCSWRTSGDVSIVRLALEDALAAGVPIVFSAGNDGSGGAHFPSDYSSPATTLGTGLLSVAAIDKADQRASYSNYASTLSLTAPGGDGLPLDERDILCADTNGGLGFAAGTSMAAPHVAAVAALLLSVDPTLTPARVKTLLTENARDISAQNPDFVGRLGTGCVDAYAALRAAVGSTPEPAPPALPDDPAPNEPPDAVPNSGPTVIASTTINATERDLLLSRLAGCRDDILASTGWQMAEVLLENDTRVVTLDTRPSDPT
jgi:subtilisin family serine protease